MKYKEPKFWITSCYERVNKTETHKIEIHLETAQQMYKLADQLVKLRDSGKLKL